MNSLLASNVPDPTDFPPITVAPGLRTLDGSLRCSICGELYDAPVTLNCGHCFCSFVSPLLDFVENLIQSFRVQCVRTSLAEKQECPGCRKAAIEGHLRPNPVMEEVVEAWKLSRPYILNLAKEDERQAQESETIVNTPLGKKRKIAPDTGARGTGASSSASRSPSRLKRTGSEATIPTSDIDEDEMPHTPKPDDLLPCPLCSKRVKFKAINRHLDNGCKDPPVSSNPPRSTSSDWKKLMAGPTNGKSRGTNDDEDTFPLPKASYGTLKDKKLKEMLVEQGLPTSGDRTQWIQRHQRCVDPSFRPFGLFASCQVHVWNAAANAHRAFKHRRTKADLRKEIKKWEDERARKRKTTVEDTTVHQKRHKDEFAQLIEAARPRGSGTGVISEDYKGVSPTQTRRALLAEQSKSDIVVSSRGTEEEGVIVVDSEEEELTRT
ncbi:hypothetical protein H0H81_000683 [Sphagnurus paluster]|uniref:Postreplication repair E3 ubiquitin-protein ligase RAD18 n=1 Tax=Sphagnurus paluster TaxID=117069 RepID=A0A9P7K5X0_9AGAR|nr:hypothetical protein H0H81_000683 [Sphagnurus paluster]